MQNAIKKLRQQIQHVIDVNGICPPNLQSKIPSMQERLQANGYEWAKKNNVLEPYKDAWGLNMRRSPDSWNKNWSRTFTFQ